MNKIERCPTCNKIPAKWYAREQFYSREMHWIGCRPDGHLAGGLTEGAAVMAWNRLHFKVKAQEEIRR